MVNDKWLIMKIENDISRVKEYNRESALKHLSIDLLKSVTSLSTFISTFTKKYI